jgi:hypothetical protein
MHKWYREAFEGYAYLADVDSGIDDGADEFGPSRPLGDWVWSFSQSRWFKKFEPCRESLLLKI